jgi:hypothetical protein
MLGLPITSLRSRFSSTITITCGGVPGSGPAITPVGDEVADERPAPFDAVTLTRSVEPTSRGTSR